MIILGNTIALALEDPTVEQQSATLQLLNFVFLVVYTVEALIKIAGMGLIVEPGSYLRDRWNILDIVIVLTGWVELLLQSGINLSALRALRILRPLRSISSIEGMKTIFKVLVSSMGPLLSTLAILFFFLLVFGIAGLQLWMGILRFRCIDTNTGSIQ